MESIPGIDRELRPAILYKYLSLGTDEEAARARDSIQHHRMWFSSRLAFNDPFDCRPTVDLSADADTKIRWMAKQYLARGTCTKHEDAIARAAHVINKTDGKDIELSKQIESQVQRHLDGIGILCLAGTASSLLMWSHYSDSHRGICIGYRSLLVGDMFDAARTVKYQKDYPSICAWTDDQCTKLKKALLTKADCWRYEKEYRILDGANCNFIREHEPENVASVILGARIDPGARDSILEAARGMESRPSLLQAELARDQFRLVLRPL
jgi:hypothetical protein